MRLKYIYYLCLWLTVKVKLSSQNHLLHYFVYLGLPVLSFFLLYCIIMNLVQAADEAEVIKKLCAIVEATAELSIKRNGKFTVGVSGEMLF